MNRLFPALIFLVLLVSCHSESDKFNFTVSGEVNNIPDQKIYLEQLFFNQATPELLDSATLQKGTFTLHAKASEQGLYRLRTGTQMGFVFINDSKTIRFKTDNLNPSFNNQYFNTPANNSLKYFFRVSDSLARLLRQDYDTLTEMQKKSGITLDSAGREMEKQMNTVRDQLTLFCLKYADTTTSPVLGVLAVTSAPLAVDKFVLPLQKLEQRFPGNSAISSSLSFIRQKLAETTTPKNEQGQTGPVIGSVAPELNMPDTSGKIFSLSSLRGKYVLVDFWASWCGPCRGENPNVVKAYQQFKNKNFTVLGVSLDKDKQSWLNAIRSDNLTWYHISDLQYWNSSAVALYGFDAIPFNVLIDPQGKVIATGLREDALQQKLAEVLH